ncbi:uncharacterized protein LOC133819364 [Humulus lupulus]|uniref:uncharacterized protein LOC133819364 n=1 Tax=Humulus lupulus TaxID=3486 RepID=UPI002B415A82|nr:uncharacterized protein LOC133819364 [Humulus lupulus]
MGCGESKHDVATGNTILHRKKSDNSITAKCSSSAKDIETVHENPPNAAADQVSQSAVKGGDSEEAMKEEEENDVLLRDDDEKNKKEKINDDDDVVVVGREVGRDSPNRFFSSRKDEELGIDMIISEGQSGKSEYNTPRHGAGAELNKDASVLGPDHHDDQDRDHANNQDLKAAVVVTQAADEKENAKAVNVEENLVKEEVEATKVEEKDLKIAEEVKSTNQNDEEKRVVG